MWLLIQFSGLLKLRLRGIDFETFNLILISGQVSCYWLDQCNNLIIKYSIEPIISSWSIIFNIGDYIKLMVYSKLSFFSPLQVGLPHKISLKMPTVIKFAFNFCASHVHTLSGEIATCQWPYFVNTCNLTMWSHFLLTAVEMLFSSSYSGVLFVIVC